MKTFNVRLIGGKVPTRAEVSGVAVGIAYDLYAPTAGGIDPLSRSKVMLGICTEFDEGWCGLILDRSGMGNKGIHRFAGLIDPSYRDDWGVILWNSTGKRFEYGVGDRIAQVIFLQVGLPTPNVVETLGPSLRIGGFGSTGN